MSRSYEAESAAAFWREQDANCDCGVNQCDDCEAAAERRAESLRERQRDEDDQE